MCWSESSAFNFPQIPPCALWGTSDKLPYRDGGAESQCDSFIGLGKKGKYCQLRSAEVRTLLFPQTGTKNDIFWYCPHERKYVSKSGIEMATFDFTVCTYYTIYCRKMEVVMLALAWIVLVSNQSIFVGSWDCQQPHILVEHLSSVLLQ